MKIRSAPAWFAAAAMAAPSVLADVATDTWSSGSAATSAARSRERNPLYAATSSGSSASTSTLTPSSPSSPTCRTSDAITASCSTWFPNSFRLRPSPKLV